MGASEVIGETNQLPSVQARLAYFIGNDEDACFRVYPPSSGRPPESPSYRHYETQVQDCRPIARLLDLEMDGFVLRSHQTAFRDFLDPQRVEAEYFPEMAALLRELTGAEAVVVFDHNVRSVAGAARGQAGVRAPVDAVHDDYTEESGKRRVAELLLANGLSHLLDHQAALINVWRPLHGPVLDMPLAVCAAPSVDSSDLVATPIHHYMEGDLQTPSHSGAIYSVRHNPRHQWHYVSRMQADEVLIFKGYDTRRHGVSRYTPHTGFKHPDCPPEFTPRESIEVRAVVVYPEH